MALFLSDLDTPPLRVLYDLYDLESTRTTGGQTLSPPPPPALGTTANVENHTMP